jgi:hypothetical protein
MLSFRCYLEVGLVKTIALPCIIKSFICSVAPGPGGFRAILSFVEENFICGKFSKGKVIDIWGDSIHDLFSFCKGVLTTMVSRGMHF